MSKSASISSDGLRSWQEISQRVPDHAISPAARRNRLVRWAGWSASVFTGVVLLTLAVWAVRLGHAAPVRGAAGTLALPLGKVQFSTDGVLTEGWVLKFLKVNVGDPLDKIDVFTLRQKLLATKQVAEAQIERQRPGTLRIALKERHPILRAAVDNGLGGYQQYLIARDGTVFEPRDFPDEILSQVPWISGMPLHRASDGTGFDAMPGMSVVADFLQAARNRAPGVVTQWSVVDLSRFDPRPNAPLSLIKIPKSGDLGQLTFVAGDFLQKIDFAKQIDRLAYAAQTMRQQSALVSGYDMSVPDQVVVRLAALSAVSPARRIR